MRNHGRKVSEKCLFDFGLSAPDTRGVCTTRETLTEMLCDEGETGASKTSHKFCCQKNSGWQMCLPSLDASLQK